MTKRDVLDKEMARRFAWRIAEPEAPPAPVEAPASAAPPAAAPPPPDPEAERVRAEYAAQRCKELAREVARVWAMTSLPEQAAATQRLLRLATRLSFDILRMDNHPLEAVRLWRLVIRHRTSSSSTARRRRSSAMFELGFMPVSSRQGEVVDLLVEAAESGDSDLAFVLDGRVATEETGRRHPELGARLARVVDTARTWKARALAARWLSLEDFPDAIPALRRALRMPHARLRYCALFVLPQMKGPALLPEDVLWLLEDAVKHPLPRDWGTDAHQRVHDYEQALLAAVQKAPPAEGWRPLEIIADGGGAHIGRERKGLSKGWALRALAAGYPERAAGRIDRALAATRGSRRHHAVEAIGLLPDELARPRLLAAAAHTEHEVVERAKALWFERFGAECPVEPLAGVAVELLAEAPSERFFACLTVLRGASDEARNAMIDALLAGAPERETPPEGLSAAQREGLALVLFALRHRGWLYKHPTLKIFEDEWASMLLGRFGAPAFTGLATIAEHAAVAGAPHGWLGALASAARNGKLSEPQKDRLREIARAALGSKAWDNATTPLDTLAVVGAPPDLEERLWSIATLPAERDGELDRGAFYAARSAVSALIAMRDAPGLEARVARAAEQARAARDWALFDRLMPFGDRHGAAAVLDVAARAMVEHDGDPEAFAPVYHGAWRLEKAGRIDGAWLLEQLRQPESPVFSLAAQLVRTATPEPAHAALRDTLESSARAGAAAAEAAMKLLALDGLALDDGRLDGILERAPAPARAALAAMLLDCGAPLAAYQRHVVELLLAPDEKPAGDVMESLYSKRPEGMDELFEELLPRVTARNVRRTMEHYLGAPSQAASYWADRDEDDPEHGEADEEEDL
jgi:hypothetical protein